jgi:hypothetical protein
MNETGGMEARMSTAAKADVGWCYGNGWRQMKSHFLELLLIALLVFAISVPFALASEYSETDGVWSPLMGMFAFFYGILILGPVVIGALYAALKAARGEKLEVTDMFIFQKNYLNVVLGKLLLGAIVAIGLVFLIIPGIFFLCKLAFVPFLLTDRKMEAVAAVKESWRMTKGHAFMIFLIFLIAVPVTIAGILCLGVGVIVSMMWIDCTIASMYYAVAGAEVEQL